MSHFGGWIIACFIRNTAGKNSSLQNKCYYQSLVKWKGRPLIGLNGLLDWIILTQLPTILSKTKSGSLSSLMGGEVPIGCRVCSWTRDAVATHSGGVKCTDSKVEPLLGKYSIAEIEKGLMACSSDWEWYITALSMSITMLLLFYWPMALTNAVSPSTVMLVVCHSCFSVIYWFLVVHHFWLVLLFMQNISQNIMTKIDSSHTCLCVEVYVQYHTIAHESSMPLGIQWRTPIPTSISWTPVTNH